jgi:hypothetical protein
MKIRASLLACGTATLTLARVSLTMAGQPEKDRPMWGGTPNRNMVSTMKGLPLQWDVAKNADILWMASLGSQSYGNPVVAGGRVYAGTNNEGLRDPKQAGDSMRSSPPDKSTTGPTRASAPRLLSKATACTTSPTAAKYSPSMPTV